MSGLFAQTGLGEMLAIDASLSYSVSLIGIRQGVRSATPIAGVLILNATVAAAGFVKPHRSAPSRSPPSFPCCSI